MAPAQEAVKALAPHFLWLPAAFAPRTIILVRNYLALCKELGREPDAGLLGPVVQALQELEKDGRSAGEEPGDP